MKEVKVLGRKSDSPHIISYLDDGSRGSCEGLIFSTFSTPSCFLYLWRSRFRIFHIPNASSLILILIPISFTSSGYITEGTTSLCYFVTLQLHNCVANGTWRLISLKLSETKATVITILIQMTDEIFRYFFFIWIWFKFKLLK